MDYASTSSSSSSSTLWQSTVSASNILMNATMSMMVSGIGDSTNSNQYPTMTSPLPSTTSSLSSLSYYHNDDNYFNNSSSNLFHHVEDDGKDIIPNNGPDMDTIETFWKEIYSKQLQLGWKFPQYYSLPYQVIGTIFQGIILIVGVLGNVMVVIVVLRSRSMRTPTNCYLVSLAVADTMVLLASVPNEIIAYYLLGNKWIWGPIGCALFIFLQYLGINASSLSIAAFTVERYIAICHPMLAHKLCTVHRAKRIIMYVWLFATAYCSPWLFLTKTEQIHYLLIETEVYTCNFKLNREHYKGYFLTDIVLFYLLPLLISCVLYALIARILYNSNDILSTKHKSSGHLTKTVSMNTNIVQQQQQHSGSPTTSKQQDRTTRSWHNHHNQTKQQSTNENKYNQVHNLPKTSTTTMVKNRSATNKKNCTSSDSSRVQVVKMLAVVVAVFATLWLPYRALVVYNSFTSPPYMNLWYLMFAKTMIFVNSAINPIIYSACSMKFRREFKRMLTCGSKAKGSYRSGGAGGTGLNYYNRSDAFSMGSMGPDSMFSERTCPTFATNTTNTSTIIKTTPLRSVGNVSNSFTNKTDNNNRTGNGQKRSDEDLFPLMTMARQNNNKNDNSNLMLNNNNNKEDNKKNPNQINDNNQIDNNDNLKQSSIESINKYSTKNSNPTTTISTTICLSQNGSHSIQTTSPSSVSIMFNYNNVTTTTTNTAVKTTVASIAVYNDHADRPVSVRTETFDHRSLNQEHQF